ncbi:hypothetical protein EV421DRAFT_1732628 [Armillaria borealis]|uniref:Zn(2)-C6 fungal-type domain-containing protein n=1 Tax=Armillaria borealis TaxID=47425 RepID=A0AA39MW88_9AGAR|nr:hypothetical protein EV421DRAFT_1732628 [Armillaria borealis]
MEMKYQIGTVVMSTTPEPYKPAPTPADLSIEDYEVLTAEQDTMEARYEEAAEEKERLWLEDKEKQQRLKQKVLAEAMVKKVLDDLAKAKEKEDEDNEKLLAATRFVPSGEEGDSKSDLMDLKAVAMAKLRKRHKIAEGKKKVGSVETQKRIEPEPMAQDKVYTGSECCGKCRTDKVTCFVHSGVCTCQHCHVKKVQCTFNKGGDNGSSAESTSVLEILQDISARLACLEDKVETVMGHMEDLVDDYDVNNEVKYPKDFIPKSVKAEFKASRMELHKTSDIYCEVLCEVAKHRLNRDMALIKAEDLQALTWEMPLGVDNPYKILNKLFWIGSISAAGLHDKMLAHNKFLQAHQDFYNTCGHQVEWQLWKRLLKDQEGYRVEDLDKPLDLEKEIRTDMIPGAESIGIPELDALIKMPMPTSLAIVQSRIL